MSQPDPSEYLERTDYDSVASAVYDAAHVIGELIATIAEQDSLFLDADRIIFLARRAHKLTAKAHAVAYTAGV